MGQKNSRDTVAIRGEQTLIATGYGDCDGDYKREDSQEEKSAVRRCSCWVNPGLTAQISLVVGG